MPAKKRSTAKPAKRTRRASEPDAEIIVDTPVEPGHEPPIPPADLTVRWPPVSYWMKVAAGVVVVMALANMVAALRQVLILILISMILAIGLQPGVTWLQRKGMRRGSAVGLIFVLGAVVVLGFLAMITPTIIGQIGQLVEQAPTYIRDAQEKNGFIADLNERFDLTGKLQQLAADLPSTALSLVKSFTALVFNGLTVLILTAYFTTALPKMERGVARLLRHDDREEFSQILDEATGLVGGYMIGNLIVSVIAGAVTFVGLLLIGVPYPAALAFWVALADLIPTVGAILGALAGVLVAAFAGVPQLVGTVIFFLIYQQIENYVIAPRVMTRTVEMSAAAVIVAVLVGGTLAGFAGALLALPAAAIIKVVVQRTFLDERVEAVRKADAEKAQASQGEGSSPKRRMRLRRRS